MSDATDRPDQATTSPDPNAWGSFDSVSKERRAELDYLEARQQAWAKEPEATRGPPPLGLKSTFMSLTGADVFYLTARALAGPDGDPAAAADRLRYPVGISVSELHLEEAVLPYAHLEGAFLSGAYLQRVFLTYLEGAELSGTHLEGALLPVARLQGANLAGAHLEGADLAEAHLEGADLSGTHLERADLTEAHLQDATLAGASFDKNSKLNGASLSGVVLDQVIFDNTNLAVVEWGEVQRLGDEISAREGKDRATKAVGYHAAARAYRALATALRTQGLGTEATRFHYRAELMARYEQLYDFLARLFSRRFYTAPAACGRWLVSWLLGTFAGYGDRIGRLLLTYVATVSVFAGLMFIASGRPPSVDSIRDVYVLSVTSFHGRGVQPPGLRMTDALATLAAVEAFFGLAIEGIFIAAFTRRVTGG